MDLRRLAKAARVGGTAFAIVAAAGLAGHGAVLACTGFAPPPVDPPAWEATDSPATPGLRRAGPSWTRRRGRIREVGLAGSPEAIGWAHLRLLREEKIALERRLWRDFEARVRFPLRTLLLDVGRVRFRRLEDGVPLERRREIAAAARAIDPDPLAERMPSYQRETMLHALYDVALSFEGSPVVGCTSFAIAGGRAEGGRTIVGRTFDLGVDAFDESKTVYFVREDGRIPFASVSWPGLVGVVTGLNAAGVAMVVHGARARSPRATGEPVVFALREALGTARDARAAARILAAREPMVSHMVLAADAAGTMLVVERAPGARSHVREATGAIALTNHLEGPLASDPANERVRRETSTIARRARLDERLAALPPGAGVEHAIDVLRDRSAAGGAPLPPGDRRAIDADIATHGVVMDATARRMWIAEGPHLGGAFVEYDVGRMLADGFDPAEDRDTPKRLAPRAR